LNKSSANNELSPPPTPGRISTLVEVQSSNSS